MPPAVPLDSHPSPQELRAFSAGAATGDRSREIEEHLRAGCALCMFAVREEIGSRAGGGAPSSGEGHRIDPQRLVERASRKALLIEVEVAVAAELMGELMLRPAAGRRDAVRESRRYKLLGLSQVLREESRREARRDVARAVELAELAAEVADCLDTGFYGVRIATDARALAWAVVGNSQRVAGDFFAAERSFQTASDLLDRGTNNPTDVAEIQVLLASLRIEQARFREAIQLLTAAAATYRSLGMTREEGKAIFKVGSAAILAGEPERAIPLFEASLDLLESAADRKLVLFAHHNIAAALQDAGRSDEARQYLDQIAPWYEEISDDRALHVQHRWLEGLVLAGVGRIKEGVERLRAVRQLFLEEERAYDVAQVTLDLAAVLLGAGETAEVQRLVREMYPIFRSRDVHRQAVAALVLFEQAVTAEAATVALARDVGRYLSRARNNPYLQFEPADFRAD